MHKEIYECCVWRYDDKRWSSVARAYIQRKKPRKLTYTKVFVSKFHADKWLAWAQKRYKCEDNWSFTVFKPERAI